jgi:hypothetical protein
MQGSENRIEMAVRHVRQAEIHIERQNQVIERLRVAGLPTEAAESFLKVLKFSLHHHRCSMRELVRQRSAGFRDESGNIIL